MIQGMRPKPVPGPFERRIVPPDMDYEYFQGAADLPFRPEARGLDAVNLWWLAELSFLAYCHPQFIRLAAHVAGMPRFRFFDGAVAECFVTGTPEYSVVFVRGTEVFSLNAFFDVIADLNVRQTDEPSGGKVHRGFKESLDEIWGGSEGLEAYLNSLRRAYGDDHRVWFTGHSLGAAIVTLAAARYPEGAGLYTFGSPRVGTREFVSSVRVPSFRIVNNRDPVALLPPSLRFPGGLEIEYGHVGSIYRFDAQGVLIHPEEEAPGPEVSAENGGESAETPQARIRRWITESVPGPPTDHAPVYYALRSWNHLVDRVASARHNTPGGGKP